MKWLISVVLAMLCILPVAGMAISQYIDGRENVAYQCAMDPELPPGIREGETALREASVTSMPAGRLCVFSAADRETVAAQTGWPSTISGIAASMLAALLTVVAWRRRGEHGAVMTLLPVVIIMVIWGIVFASAHTASV
ncbi:MAG TPA: hypothetical protein VN035_14635 [Microbacterium sp.]|nr:hypothetical protein [Microbacterium sp.]